jgi:phosphate transport system substrate-binding protein
MAYTRVQNAAGKFVAPDAKSFAAAAATADWAHARDFNLVMTNAPGASSYPIAATTFVLMYKKPKNVSSSQSARKFFSWALTKGQPQALGLDYVPLPAPLVKRIQSYVGSNIR